MSVEQIDSTRNLIVASVFNDPEARLVGMLRDYGSSVNELIGDKLVVAVSARTAPEIVEELKDQLVNFSQEETQLEVVDAYKRAIGLALELKPAFIQVVDFDRLLHWVSRFPEEIRDLTNRNYRGLVSYLRTARAFETHSLAQKETERVINEAASKVAGQKVDIMSGSFGLENKLAGLVLEKLSRRDSGFYTEFLALAIKGGYSISTVVVEGLEWETPDQYQSRIAEIGYEAWLSEYQSQAEWQRRRQMMQNCLEVLAELEK